MKIKFGAIVTDGRGKLGGHVFSKNGAGAFMRTKVTPTNPQTMRQSSVRALFGAISALWSTLTEANRNAWNSAVSEWQQTNIFGDLKKPDGKALFQRLNNQAQVVGLAAVTTPPAKLEMPDDIVSDVEIAITAGEIILTDANASATTQVVIYATGSLSQGTRSVSKKLRQIYYSAGNAYDVTAAYDAFTDKFGIPVAGANVYVGVKYVLASGQSSPMQIIKSSVTA